LEPSVIILEGKAGTDLFEASSTDLAGLSVVLAASYFLLWDLNVCLCLIEFWMLHDSKNKIEKIFFKYINRLLTISYNWVCLRY